MNFWKLTERRPEKRKALQTTFTQYMLAYELRNLCQKEVVSLKSLGKALSLPEPELVSTKLSFRVRFGWFDPDKNVPKKKKKHQPLRSHVAINSDGNICTSLRVLTQGVDAI